MLGHHIRRISVASGDYAMSSRCQNALEAYLGTCVGVAIVDDRADLGGLLHILLPEPTSDDLFGRPTTYALTGIPFFIEELCSKGARIQDMKATIAGGALVGPLSDLDLHLDIGGRTAEIVERLLNQAGVQIEKCETGGFFSCRLSLNLNTWETDIEPVGTPPRPGETAFAIPTDEDLLSRMERIRPIPQIALKIIRMIGNDDASLVDMAEEVRKDQVISARVMRLCNSAFFRKEIVVDSIDRALIMMGEKQLLQLVVSASLDDFFSQSREGGYSLCKGGLFNHAIGTAAICELLASRTGKVDRDIAYTAGLLHDIGKVVLDQYMNVAYPLFYRRTQVENENLILVEREVFGASHTEVGGRLAKRWSLPEDLIDVIMHHHYPEQALIDPYLTHIVYLADLLMSRFFAGLELERINTNSFSSRLDRLGLAPDQLPSIIESIPQKVFHFPTSGTADPQ